MITHGSPNFQTLGYTLARQSPGFDPQFGVTWVQVYTGLPSQLASLALGLQAQGARTLIDNPDGGPSTLTVTWSRNPNQDPSSEVATDRWDFGVESYQVNVFSHPSVVREMERLGTNGPSEYQRSIREAVDAGDPNPLSVATYPLSQICYELLAQGVEYWEFSRPTLRRTRTYSQTFIGQPQVVTPQQVVYTRSSLINAFNIPIDVQSRIPLDPPEAPRAGAVWGWRLRNQSSGLVRETRATKIEEVLDWDFAEWLASPIIGQSLYILR
jgi:hypothetical protein